MLFCGGKGEEYFLYLKFFKNVIEMDFFLKGELRFSFVRLISDIRGKRLKF